MLCWKWDDRRGWKWDGELPRRRMPAVSFLFFISKMDRQCGAVFTHKVMPRAYGPSLWNRIQVKIESCEEKVRYG
jgi:hypothetical protein